MTRMKRSGQWQPCACAGVLLLVVSALMISACKRTYTPYIRDEITGTRQERVDQVTTIMGRHCTLPGLLLDAHLVQDRSNTSRGVPAPTDYYILTAVQIDAADLSKWRTLLGTPVSSSQVSFFYGPLAPPAWWPAEAVLASCEFYESKILTGRDYGFVALSPSTSMIYISTAIH